MERGVGHPGVGNVLQGGVTGNGSIWIRVMGPVGRNGEDGIGYTNGVPVTDHKEAGAEKIIWDVGDDGVK